jgi:1,4-alpha-glucan branching enzyme
VGRVIERLDSYQRARARPGLVVCALDTELLGHWWYEGPAWLAAVVEEARDENLELLTLQQAVERHETHTRELSPSSWGVGKDLRTWDSRAAAGLVWSARKAELALTGLVDGRARPTSGLERAARELLALQSSDWAFMATRDLAADYPWRRVEGHASAFEQAVAPARGLVDSRAMTSPVSAELRGLAPHLRLDALLEPASGWGRR